MTISRELSFLKNYPVVKISSSGNREKNSCKPDQNKQVSKKEVRRKGDKAVRITLQTQPNIEVINNSETKNENKSTKSSVKDFGTQERLNNHSEDEEVQLALVSSSSFLKTSDCEIRDLITSNKASLQKYEIQGKDNAISSLKKIQDGSEELEHLINIFR